MAEQAVKVKLLGDASNLGRALDGAGKKLNAFGGKLRAAGKVAGVALAAGVLAAGAAVLSLGSSFDQAFRDIETGTGASGAALEGLTDSFKDILRAGPDSMGKVAQATADLNTELGLTDDALESAARAALDTSRIFGVDMGGTIKGVADAMGIFSVEADQFEEQLDLMAKVSQDTGVPIDKLASQMQTFGPVLANAGFRMEDTTLLFGKLQAAGVDVTRVMPAMNAAFRRAATGGVTDMGAEFDSWIEQIETAETDVEKLSIATGIFGAEGAQRMVSAINQGVIPSFDNATIAMHAAQGTIADLSEGSLTMGQRFSQIKNSLAVGLEPVITRVFGLLEEAIDTKVMPAIERLSLWFEENEGQINAVLNEIADAVLNLKDMFLEGFDVILPILEKFWGFLRDNKPAMIAAIAAIGVALVLALGPVSGAALGIAGLITAIGYLKRNWDKIKEAINRGLSVFDKLDGRLAAILPIFFGPLGLIIAMIKFRREIKSAMSSAWTAVQGMVDPAIERFNQIKAVVEDLIGKIAGLVSAIKNIPGAGAIGGAAGAVGGVFSAIPGFADGGVVPGLRGAAQLAVVHGGEEVLTPAQRTRRGGGGITLIVQVTQPLGTPAQIGKAVGGAIRTLEKSGTITRITTV